MSDVVPDGYTPTPEIPNKLYFKIGEVSNLLTVEPYVLRFWETEFPKLAPKKTDKGQRMYRRKDVELLLQIKHLLYEKKYTIEGARQFLQGAAKTPPKPHVVQTQGALFGGFELPEIRKELAAILELLSEK
ncbi:MAG TPA: MerR family transcriptional regulator [Bryobacteraceae bacterium]|jgi:DNA-binding transcriptional MerR regulator